MTSLEQLIEALADAFGSARRAPSAELALLVESVDVDLPLEARIRAGGLEASLPRGLLATGFDPPLGRLRFRLEGEAGAAADGPPWPETGRTAPELEGVAGALSPNGGVG